MDIKKYFVKIRQSIVKIGIFYLRLFQSYLKSFYAPAYYRDVVYREDGYGFKRLLLSFLGLMIISYFIIGFHLISQYETIYKARIMTLPNLQIEKNKLQLENKSLFSTKMINPNYFLFLNSSQFSVISSLQYNQKIIMNEDFLWLPIMLKKYFGYCFSNFGNFLPIIIWGSFKDQVNGKIILEHLNWTSLLLTLFSISIPIYIFNCFFILMSIRLFAHIARKMVMMALKDALEYKLTCRLLSLSAIPTMTYMALIINIWGVNEYTKYLFIGISMLNYYIGLRIIKAKSQFRWLNA